MHPEGSSHHHTEPRPALAGADLAWTAPCPCGCDRTPDSKVPGHRLDPGLFQPIALADTSLGPFAWEAPTPSLPIVFLDRPDLVPLFA